ncbi:unnamed protein product [Rhodiola kirilowii]
MASFRLGAGLGLTLVATATKSELDKMMELRKQMEMIVEDAKEDLRCKATVCKSSQSCENPTCSTITIEESLNCIGGVSDPSCVSESGGIQLTAPGVDIVAAILVLYGLPRLLTGAILTHELMHGWLRINGYHNLNPEVEEGICQMLSYMWLEAEVLPGFKNVPSTSTATSSSTSRPRTRKVENPI